MHEGMTRLFRQSSHSSCGFGACSSWVVCQGFGLKHPRCAFFFLPNVFYDVPFFIDAEIKTFTMSTIRIALSLLVVLQVGCGSESGIPTAPVSGIVTREGKPLPGVEVFFSTDKFEGYGKTNESGPL